MMRCLIVGIGEVLGVIGVAAKIAILAVRNYLTGLNSIICCMPACRNHVNRLPWYLYALDC
jgi:hypothetical protein